MKSVLHLGVIGGNAQFAQPAFGTSESECQRVAELIAQTLFELHGARYGERELDYKPRKAETPFMLQHQLDKIHRNVKAAQERLSGAQQDSTATRAKPSARKTQYQQLTGGQLEQYQLQLENTLEDQGHLEEFATPNWISAVAAKRFWLQERDGFDVARVFLYGSQRLLKSLNELVTARTDQLAHIAEAQLEQRRQRHSERALWGRYHASRNDTLVTYALAARRRSVRVAQGLSENSDEASERFRAEAKAFFEQSVLRNELLRRFLFESLIYEPPERRNDPQLVREFLARKGKIMEFEREMVGRERAQGLIPVAPIPRSPLRLKISELCQLYMGCARTATYSYRYLRFR